MKKILVLIITLFIAIIAMAYLYFNGLNTDQKNNENSLYAATLNSSIVLSFENDRGILDILGSQGIFREITGEVKFTEMESLKAYLIAIPEINKAIEKQTIYISLILKGDKEIDFLYSTQLNTDISVDQLVTELKKHNLSISKEKKLSKITLPDSTILYLGIKDRVVLLSSNPTPVQDVLNATLKSSKFTDYIKTSSRIKKNTLAELHINFASIPYLLKASMPGKLTGELAFLDKLPAFASLSYNFSKEKMLLTGISDITETGNYLKLFDKVPPQKMSITNLLPASTSSYTFFAAENYTNFEKYLQEWFVQIKESDKRKAAIEGYNQKYRIDLNQVFPKYFKNQFISLQLGNSEKLGAIALSNGEKLSQLLLDLSTEYSPEIKSFKEENLLYYYFGEPFKKFKRPFYCVIDNYIVFANNPSTIQSFLNSYRSNQLLINNQEYIDAVNQLASTASISYYVGFRNSEDIFRKNLYLPYYKQLINQKGMRDYTAFIYQLDGDQGKFQTNVLMNKKSRPLGLNTAAFENDSLSITTKANN